MEPPIRPLVASLHEIPDPRYPRGRQHPPAAILALMCVAMRCGYRSYSAIADWGRCYGQKLARALGFTHAKTPCAATLYHVLRQLDGNLVEATLGTWAESVLTALPPAPGELVTNPSCSTIFSWSSKRPTRWRRPWPSRRRSTAGTAASSSAG
jgi:hypothetical protein